MNWSSYLLSLCLHAAFILLVLFWPTSPPVRLDSPPVMISLVDGAPGGNRTPSNILGKMGEPTNGPQDISPPAKKDEVARRARPERAEAVPVAEEKAPQPKIPEPRQQPKEEAVPLAQKKEPEKPKEKPREEPKEKPKEPPKEKPKEQPKEKPKEEPKEKPKDKDAGKDKPKEKPKTKPKGDPVKDALAQARRSASSRVESGDRGNAVEQALAQARRNAGGTGGGGGGEGDGPGGGGLNEAYLGTVMLSVRPNWSFASASRANMSCVVHIVVNMQGEVQQATVTQSSGNAQYDASAVNAIWRTSRGGEFPPPPSAEFTELDLVFTLNEMMGR
ncbi:cell envelope integrity protein TolA [uncultured Desulfovibrio sp.]|uniref:cell envelope integrity protein TolA n=1 Tax=uncultured Desulfovibrio sp. TaxID=167968 RepID=UPI002607B78D|nr:cell envelope integrity protein TolA [uncultured Desulfovibrio sp.]